MKYKLFCLLSYMRLKFSMENKAGGQRTGKDHFILFFGSAKECSNHQIVAFILHTNNASSNAKDFVIQISTIHGTRIARCTNWTQKR